MSFVILVHAHNGDEPPKDCILTSIITLHRTNCHGFVFRVWPLNNKTVCAAPELDVWSEKLNLC